MNARLQRFGAALAVFGVLAACGDDRVSSTEVENEVTTDQPESLAAVELRAEPLTSEERPEGRLGRKRDGRASDSAPGASRAMDVRWDGSSRASIVRGRLAGSLAALQIGCQRSRAGTSGWPACALNPKAFLTVPNRNIAKQEVFCCGAA